MGKQQELHQPRGKGGDRDRCQQIPAAVLLLQPRPYQQNQQHVAHIVLVVRVAQHVAEEPHVGQRVGQRCAVHGEILVGRRAVGPVAQQQGQQAQQGKRQDHRCIEAYHDLLQLDSLFSNAIKASIL